MATLDKIYVSSYEEWEEVMKWAKNAVYTCPSGIKLRVMDYCYKPEYTEEEIQSWLKKSSSGEIPVMCTSESLDYFLIKDCPIERIKSRMIEVYGQEYVNEVLEGKSKYDVPKEEESIGRHVSVLHAPKKKHGRMFIDVLIPGIEYNGEYDVWFTKNELGDSDNSCPVINSFKALIRKLRKWGFPVGTKIKIEGGGLLMIKK